MEWSRSVIMQGNIRVPAATVCQWGDVDGQEQLYSPLHWFGRKLPDFPQSTGVPCPFPAARVLPGPGGGPSPSSKAEPVGAVAMQGSFQTHWSAQQTVFTSFVIENMIVTAVCFSRDPFALSIAKFTDTLLILLFFPPSIQAVST